VDAPTGGPIMTPPNQLLQDPTPPQQPTQAGFIFGSIVHPPTLPTGAWAILETTIDNDHIGNVGTFVLPLLLLPPLVAPPAAVPIPLH
jgi:hypothetical protein